MTTTQIRKFKVGETVTLTACHTMDHRLVERPTLEILRVERLNCGCQRLTLPRPEGGRIEVCVGPHCGSGDLVSD